MKVEKHGQMSESFFLGAVLTIAGGFLDAYTYVSRGHVFANAQTGNIVLLGLNLAESRWDKVIYYLIPILAFALGVVAAEVVRHRFLKHPAIHWRQIIVACEIFLLGSAAFIPRGSWDLAVNVAVSFLCAMQVHSFRKIRGMAAATTMCTGNLRSGTECLYRFHQTKDKKDRSDGLQYFAILLFFIAGAALGAVLTGWFAEKAVLFCCAVLAVAFVVMFRREPGKT